MTAPTISPTVAPTVASAIAHPRPDVEALVWSLIEGLDGKKSSWAYAANDAGTPRGWLSIVSVQVDIRARNKQLAYAIADEARRLLLALPGQRWPGGVVNRVDVTEGPFWFPDVQGAPRYTVRLDITVHPWAQPAVEGETA